MRDYYLVDVRPSVLRAIAGNVYCYNQLCMAVAGSACKGIKDFHIERLKNAYSVLRDNNPTVKRDYQCQNPRQSI